MSGKHFLALFAAETEGKKGKLLLSLYSFLQWLNFQTSQMLLWLIFTDK
jgi:hypothetical protein